jgi:hypothetical protein
MQRIPLSVVDVDRQYQGGNQGGKEGACRKRVVQTIKRVVRTIKISPE